MAASSSIGIVHLESVEPRLLLSFASLSAHGTLSVVGTGQNDSIVVKFNGSKTQASLNGQTLSFNKADVKRIWADGFGGNDTITNKTNLPSMLLGSSGNDSLVGGTGDDSLEGGSGNDTADYSSRTGNWDFTTPSDASGPNGAPTPGVAASGMELDTISADTETYIGSNQADTFTTLLSERGFTCDGRAGDDTFILGDGETATLLGGNGNDTFLVYDTNGEQDQILGQAGNDVVWLNDQARLPSFDGGSGIDTVDLSTSNRGLISLADAPGVEDVIGAQFRIVIGNDLDNLLAAAPNAAGPVTLIGGNGNDSLIGGPNNDSLSGGAGNDTIDGGLGADTIDGGGGTDWVSYASRTKDVYVYVGNTIATSGEILEGDRLINIENAITGSGNDYFQADGPDNNVFFGGDGNDTMHGDYGNDTLVGQGGNDQLDGGYGNDAIVGGDGNDLLLGSAGNDTLRGDAGADIFQGGSGNDTADYSARSDKLNITLDNVANDGAPGEGDDVRADVENVLGGSGADRIVGNPFSNILSGNAGNDTIFGGAGNDTLIGGPGTDHLDGQGGTNVIIQ